MKKFLVAVAFGLAALAAQAEATFDQIQGLIEQRQYQAAEQGLEVIIQNHPKSAKAFYAMAQAQAGLGNQEKARRALDIATGLNPTLDFAPASSVASLKQAITPQVSKIEAIEESHTVRNVLILLLIAGIAGTVFVLYKRKQEEESAEEAAREQALAELRAERDRERERVRQAEAAEEAAREKLRQHKNYGNERFDPTNPDVLLPKKTKAQLKAEADALAKQEAESEARRQRLRAEAAEEEARRARSYSAPAPTVVHTNSSSNDMLTGVLIGNMLSNSGHHHDTERTVIRETVREVPAPQPSRSSSWDDTPSTPSRSSSWDDDSSSKKSSSSWSSSSDSSSSSSWDSGSSSSDSSSSSSWD